MIRHSLNQYDIKVLLILVTYEYILQSNDREDYYSVLDWFVNILMKNYNIAPLVYYLRMLLSMIEHLGTLY